MRRGFTLVELAIVMLLVGILGAVAAPRLLDNSGLAERAAADELRGLLRTSRQIAAVHERDVCVLVTAADARAVYTSGTGCDPALPVQGPAGQGALRVAAPNGMVFGGDASIRFTPRGALSPQVNRRVTLRARQWLVHADTGSVS